MGLCQSSVAAEQQSKNPEAASSNAVGRLGLAEEKSSRAMSRATLMASRSAQSALMSCLALRRPRAMPVVSAMICEAVRQYVCWQPTCIAHLSDSRTYCGASCRNRAVSGHIS